MADTRPLLPSDRNALLPGGGSSPGNGIRRSHVKEVLAMFAAAVMVSLLVVIIGNINTSGREGNNDEQYGNNRRSKTPVLLAANPASTKTRVEKLRAVSRGMAEGVSEKSSRLYSDGGVGAGTPVYPWNNSMLSWQRTVFV